MKALQVPSSGGYNTTALPGLPTKRNNWFPLIALVKYCFGCSALARMPQIALKSSGLQYPLKTLIP